MKDEEELLIDILNEFIENNLNEDSFIYGRLIARNKSINFSENLLKHKEELKAFIENNKHKLDKPKYDW
ncbi:hypothetical protein HERIO_1184 [Hepatospora eriocheir]|nr:hypothetical protein HERIO_1184 [Hepatospora eriocheir]